MRTTKDYDKAYRIAENYEKNCNTEYGIKNIDYRRHKCDQCNKYYVDIIMKISLMMCKTLYVVYHISYIASQIPDMRINTSFIQYCEL